MTDLWMPPWHTKAAAPAAIEQTWLPVTFTKADDGGPGEITGFAAVYGNVDLQGDLFLPGAFKRSLEHWSRAKTRIPLVDGHMARDTDRLLGSVIQAVEAKAAGREGVQFRAGFSATQRAQDARTKAIEGHLSGVSVGWLPDGPDAMTFREGADGIVRVIKAAQLFEISLTPIPANPEATVLSAKSAVEVETQAAIGSHGTATSDSAWDGPANEARLPNSAGALRAAFAWRDAEGDADAKASYRFIHHFVSEDGTVGAASTTAASTGIAVLNGGRGGTTIPSGDRSGVYAHLAKHLRDAGREPPELKALGMSWEQFEPELKAAMTIGHPIARKAAVDALVSAYDHAPVTPPGSADGPPTGDGPAGTDPPTGNGSPASTPDSADRFGYALQFLTAGSPDGAPDGGPPVLPAALADPIRTLDASRAVEDLDRAEAELRAQLGQGGETP